MGRRLTSRARKIDTGPELIHQQHSLVMSRRESGFVWLRPTPEALSIATTLAVAAGAAANDDDDDVVNIL